MGPPLFRCDSLDNPEPCQRQNGLLWLQEDPPPLPPDDDEFEDDENFQPPLPSEPPPSTPAKVQDVDMDITGADPQPFPAAAQRFSHMMFALIRQTL